MNSHLVMSMQGDSSVIKANNPPKFSALDVEGWYGASLEDAGLFAFMFRIDANAPTYPIHSDPASWIGYIISGGGKLYCGDIDGNQSEFADYSAGDFITFMPDTPHGWQNGDIESEILLIKKADS